MKLTTYRRASAIVFLLIFQTINSLFAQESYETRVNKYIEKYKDLAILEQQRTGVPASITLAQGVLETQAGASELCLSASNHFGIKCKKEWQGQTYSYTDDAPDECFRKYSCANDSYIDHSDYLRSQPRYATLFRLKPTDYKGWATGLKKCGYATSPTYAPQLIKIIENFKLQEYTLTAQSPDAKPAIAAVATPVATKRPATVAKNTDEVVPEEDNTENLSMQVETPKYIYKDHVASTTDDLKKYSNNTGSFKANGYKAFYGHKGDVLLEHAINYKMRYAHLLEINDLPDAPLEADMLVYLEKKGTKGLHDKHIVQEGENLLLIAQAEAIQLKQLRAYNMLDVDEEPAVGASLNLTEAATSKPVLRGSMVVVQQSQGKVAPKAPEATIATVHKNEEAIALEEQKTETAVNITDVMDAELEKNPPTVPEKVLAAPTPPKAVVASTPVVPEKTPATVPPAPPSVPSKTDAALNKPEETPVVKEIPEEEAPEPVVVKETTPAPAKPAMVVKETKAPVVAAEAKPETKNMSEFDRLKARLDKVVYAGDDKSAGTGNTAPKTDILEDEETAASEQETAAATPSVRYYVVKKGDTAFDIAKRYNISMQQLRQWNKLDFQSIKVGQKLIVKK